jgi:hypothetical protein
MRTTLDIDDPILAELKRLQQRDGRSLGRLVSDLLVEPLAQQALAAREPPAVKWVVQAMGAKVDLGDREAWLDALDEPLP